MCCNYYIFMSGEFFNLSSLMRAKRVDKLKLISFTYFFGILAANSHEMSLLFNILL